jgi:hypothetical protein
LSLKGTITIMQLSQILRDLDSEIARLQQARALLAGTATHGSSAVAAPGKRKPGRPAGSGKLSLEGRRRIAEAMKRSWALRKRKAKAAAKK